MVGVECTSEAAEAKGKKLTGGIACRGRKDSFAESDSDKKKCGGREKKACMI